MIINSIYIEITNQCNLNCSYCYNSSNRNIRARELKIDAITQIIEFFINLGIKDVTFSGGEPSLHSNYEKLFEIIKTYEKINFTIITNGTTYFSELYSVAKKFKNLFFQISLDGANEIINMRTRGKDNFNKTMSTIFELVDGVNPVLLKMVVSKHNKDNIDEFIQLAKKYNCIPFIGFVNKMGRAKNIWDNIILSYTEKNAVNKKLDEFYFNQEIKLEKNKSNVGCPLEDFEKHPQNLLIKPNGDIQPCQILYDSSFTIGNALNFSRREIFEGANRVKQISIDRNKIIYDCFKCINRSVCDKGCMALAHNNYGDCLERDGECESRRLKVAQMFMNKFMKKDFNEN